MEQTIRKITNCTIIQIQISNKVTNLEKVTSKEKYLTLKQNKFEPPTCINTWLDRFNLLENINWRYL